MTIDNPRQLKYPIQEYVELATYPIAALAAIATANGINTQFIYILSILMGLDFAMGVARAALLPQLDNPSSQKATLGLIKKALVLVIIGVIALVFKVLSETAMPYLVNTLIAIFVVAEGYSVIGNIYMIYTGEVLSEFDAVTAIIKGVGSKLETLVKKMLNRFVDSSDDDS